jgi:hypothetical protein
MDKWDLLRENLEYALEQLGASPPSDKNVVVEVTIENILKTMRDLEGNNGTQDSGRVTSPSH